MPPCVSDCGIPFGLALWGAYKGELPEHARSGSQRRHAACLHRAGPVGDEEIEADARNASTSPAARPIRPRRSPGMIQPRAR